VSIRAHPDHLEAGQYAGLIAVRQPRSAIPIVAVLILVVRTRLLVNIGTNGYILRARQMGRRSVMAIHGDGLIMDDFPGTDGRC